jgi:D-alanyl-D-alanine carboxypeptidase/D-alanyl-D-alanine-endopeptidase (penicillin-binding protein 4)
VLVLALAAVAVIRPGPVDRWLGGGDNAQPPPAAVENTALPPPVLAVAGSDAPAPTAVGIKGALDPLVADPKLGGRVFVSVVDPVTGDHLYERSPATPAVPASTTKLVTGLTVLAARGPSYRLATRAVAGTRPGEVVLIGGGDATLATGPTGTYPGAARLDELAAAVKQALGATPPTKVIVDTSLFTGPAYGPGWDSDASTGGYGTATTALMTDAGRVNPRQVKVPAQRHEKPDVAAGQAFAKALGLPASAVTTGKAPPALNGPAGASPPAASGTAVAPGTELGKIESPPMARLVEMMLSESDNVIAECLARQVALAKNLPASYAGAAEAMKAVLADLGLPAAEDGLVDGSGLSRNDRLTPSLLTGLLAFAARADRPDLHGLFSGLPVAGYSGTLRDRFRSAGPTRPGAGLVRAKTGTLSGVNAIAGIVVTQDGRLLTFAVLADRVTGGQFPAQDALDKIATALATCGCR